MRYNGSFRCSVEYILQANIVRQLKGVSAFASVISTSRWIDIHSPSTQAERAAESAWPYRLHSRFLKIQQPGLLSKIRRHGARSNQSEPTPRPGFQLYILVPGVIETEAEASISLPILVRSCNVAEEDYDGTQVDTGLPYPPLVIRYFTISIILSTRVRAGRQTGSEDRRIVVGKGGACEVPISTHLQQGLQDDIDHASILSNAVVDLGKVSNARLSAKLFVPGFSTYNVFRDYHFELKLWVQHLHKKSTVAFRNIPITLLSERARAAPMSRRWDCSDLQSFGCHAESVETLPCYQERE